MLHCPLANDKLGVFRGYWNNEKATKESFFDGDWYRTGDIAQIDEHGNYL